MKHNHYQNSLCNGGLKGNYWLHEWEQISQDSRGVKEVCKKCKLVKFWKFNTPNYIFLSFHLKSALTRSDPLFAREWPNMV
jgi:hypothetical protein